MVNNILSLFTTAVTAVGSWFTRILEATGMKTVYIVYVFIFLSISILLMPVIGGRLVPGAPFIEGMKSDRARRRARDQGSFGNSARNRAGAARMRQNGFKRGGDL